MKQLSRIIKNSNGYIKYLILLPVAVLCDVMCEVYLPYVMADILNEGFSTGNIEYIVKKGVVMALTAIALTIAGMTESYCGSRYAAGYVRNIREKLFQKIQSLSLDSVGKFGTASLMTRLTVDMNAIKKAIGMLASLIKCPMLIIFATYMTSRINTSLSWIFLAVLPVFAIVLFVLNKLARKHYKAMFIEYDKMNNILNENVSGIKTVKAYVREKLETDIFISSAKNVRDESRKAETITTLNSTLLQFVLNMSILMLVYFGGMDIIKGKLNPGELFCMITYANQILSQVWIISLMLIPVLSAQVSLNRIFDVIEAEDIYFGNVENAEARPTDGSIEFHNVSFSYDKSQKNKSHLKDINLSIPSGSFVGITGVSGSSKTTLINQILRLCERDEGSVCVGGKDVRDYKVENLRNEIAVVPQKSILFSGTIAENLRIGRQDATDSELEEACRIADAYDFVMSSKQGLGTQLYQGGTNLSGGQRQRLCIARALVRKPKILILDDSLSAVDNNTERSISEKLLNSKGDMTIVMISQRLSAIRKADKIFVLEAGGINGCGTHDELLESNVIYKELFESQRRHVE